MIPVDQAQSRMLEQVQPLPPQSLQLGAGVLGLVLAQEICSSNDSPPFAKALMDGFAVRSDDCANGQAELEIIEEVTAGRVAKKEVQAGQATQIMTGAPIPTGADAVVMIERCVVRENRVLVQDRPKPAQNVLPRGREMRAGEKILSPGTRIGPVEIGLLSAVGNASVRVQPRPRVTVLSTGDEIVEVHQTPGPGQIRNSNGMMLLAQTQRAGATARTMLIVPDDRDRLRRAIQQGLDQGEAVVLSGGVSAGKLDLVPGVLESLGVALLLHKVRMKPGKPMHFGVLSKPDGDRRYVFALPGNPVSSLVCFELFVRPALRKMRGLDPGPNLVSATLREDFPYRTDRPTYHPARLDGGNEGWSVRAVPWLGSADLRGVAAGNALLVLPEGDRIHRAGERFSVLRMEGDDL